MKAKVLDLIKMAADGESLPSEIILKVPKVTNSKWKLFGDYYHSDYYNGELSLGSLVAFSNDWLNAEIEFAEEES